MGGGDAFQGLKSRKALGRWLWSLVLSSQMLARNGYGEKEVSVRPPRAGRAVGSLAYTAFPRGSSLGRRSKGAENGTMPRNGTGKVDGRKGPRRRNAERGALWTQRSPVPCPLRRHDLYLGLRDAWGAKLTLPDGPFCPHLLPPANP